jgi:hypothetical protein
MIQDSSIVQCGDRLLQYCAVKSRGSWSTFQRCFIIRAIRPSTCTKLHVAITQKAAIFIFATVRTLSLAAVQDYVEFYITVPTELFMMITTL